MTSKSSYLIFTIAVLILALGGISVPVTSAKVDAASLAAQSQQDNPGAISLTAQPSRETDAQPPDVQTLRDSISALQDSIKQLRLDSTAWQAQIPWLLVAVIVFVAVLYWLIIAMTNTTKAQEKLLYIPYIALVFLIALGIYRFVLLPAPTAITIPTGSHADVLDKLGPRTAVGIIVTMMLLLAWLFWLFIQFGRRLAERGYLGPLTKDALARAEIARRDDDLKEDLRLGIYGLEVDLNNQEFRDAYRIPSDARPPSTLAPGVRIDDAGRILYPEEESFAPARRFTGTGSGSGTGTTPRAVDVESWPAEKLQQTLAAADEEADSSNAIDDDTLYAIKDEIAKRFREGYRQEQLKAFYKARMDMTTEERARADTLIPQIDVSAFGGGWVFVLEFTTIIFIVFAALALGFVGVLEADHIGTILASIAGYVLGKSTSVTGRETRRAAEGPKAPSKQDERKAQPDEDKIKLQEKVVELQRKLALKVTVPKVEGLDVETAETKLKAANLVAEKREVEDQGKVAGTVVSQSPEPDTKVDKDSTVKLSVAKKPSEA